MFILPQRAIEDFARLMIELNCKSYVDALSHYIDKGYVIREGNTGEKAYFDMNYRSLAVTIMECGNGLCEINTRTIEYYDEQ